MGFVVLLTCGTLMGFGAYVLLGNDEANRSLLGVRFRSIGHLVRHVLKALASSGVVEVLLDRA